LTILHDVELFLDAVVAALPLILVLVEIRRLNRGHHVQKLVLVQILIFLEEDHEVAVESGLLHETVPRFLLSNAVEGVAHNRDQHVQEDDLREERGHDEVNPLQVFEVRELQRNRVKVAQSQQVLVDPSVSERVARLFLHRVLVVELSVQEHLLLVLIKNELRRCEGTDDQQVEDDEGFEVCDSLHDHFDIEGH
jgi:hypothetical protein